VVRIEDSLPAPLFDVVARPDNWERLIHEKAAETERGITEIGTFRREFWTFHCSRHPSEGRATAAHHLVHRVEETDVFVVSWLGNEKVGVFYRGPRGQPTEVFAFGIADVADVLAERLHGAGWLERRERERLSSTLLADMQERGNWERASDWLAAERRRFTVAAAEVLNGRAARLDTGDQR
jgi:hypothetical protein